MDKSTRKPQPLLTVADVAEWLNVSPSLVYQLVDSGKLPVVRVGNGRGAIRFQTSDVEAYLAASRVQRVKPQAKPRRGPLKHLKL